VHQHKGLFIFIADIGRRLKIKKSFSSETLEKFEQVDGHIQDFYKKNRKGFWIALISHFIGRMLGILEIYIIGIAVTPIFTMKLAILLGAAVPIISFAFAFIPGTIGVLESAYTAILYFLNFQPSVGMTIQIVRRIRSIVWIGLGFLFLGVHNRKKILAQEA
jgi:uncharacterized membrane protein YbhN (UPF0104 family)